ncbi:MAG: acyltransferase [Solobacterium sp.]|nr:acyltransferase [Solobacterium sp.]
MQNIKYKDLFQYRSVWMGFAIIWIMIYHSELIVENRLLWMIKNVGYCGVDLFFFASGIGCYYSYQRLKDPYAFMKRRISRIIPPYWIFLTVLCLTRLAAGTLRPGTVIGDYLCLEYFVDPELDLAFNWYMGSIWVMYLLVPYFWQLIEKHGQKSLLIIPLLLLASTVFWHQTHFILTATRVPIFFIGMYYEYLALNDREMSGKDYLKLLIMAAIGFAVLVPSRLLITDNEIMWGCGVLFYPFILMTPFICITMSLICRIGNPVIQGLRKLFELAGRYSFELYLVHHLIFELGARYFRGTPPFVTTWFWFVLYLAAVPAAWLLNRAAVLFSRLFQKINCVNN